MDNMVEYSKIGELGYSLVLLFSDPLFRLHNLIIVFIPYPG